MIRKLLSCILVAMLLFTCIACDKGSSDAETGASDDTESSATLGGEPAETEPAETEPAETDPIKTEPAETNTPEPAICEHCGAQTDNGVHTACPSCGQPLCVGDHANCTVTADACPGCSAENVIHQRCLCGTFLCDETHGLCFTCDEIADYHGEFAVEGLAIHCPGCLENGIVHTQCQICGDYMCRNTDTHGSTCACAECVTDPAHHLTCPICEELFSVGDHTDCRCADCGMLHQFHERCEHCGLHVCILHIHDGDEPDNDAATYVYRGHAEWKNDHLFLRSTQRGWAHEEVSADFKIVVTVDNGALTVDYYRVGSGVELLMYTFAGTYVRTADDRISLTVTSGQKRGILTGQWESFTRQIVGSATITVSGEAFAEDISDYLQICNLCLNTDSEKCQTVCDVCEMPECIDSSFSGGHCHGEHATLDADGYCTACSLQVACKHPNAAYDLENDDGTVQGSCLDCGCYTMPQHDHSSADGDAHCDTCLDKIG